MNRAPWLALAVLVIVSAAVFYRVNWPHSNFVDVLGSSQPSTSSDVYVGLSDQRLPVKLAVSGDRRALSLDVTWIARCRWHPVGRRPAAIQNTVRARATRIADDGSFSWRSAFVEAGNDGDEQRQRLRLRGRRAADGTLTGTWRAEQDFYNGQLRAVERRCSTGDVQFRVKRGGNTRQPAPTTDASGNRIIPVEGTPDVIAVGAGAAWVSSVARDRGAGALQLTVREVHPHTGRVGARSTIYPWYGPLGDATFAAGAGGGWVPIQRRVSARGVVTPGMLRRIDARTDEVTTSPPHHRLRGLIDGVAVGAGAVWLLVNVEASVVTGPGWRGVLRADARTGRIVRSIALPPDPRIRATRRCRAGVDVAELLSVGAGAVWVTSTATYGCQTPGTRHNSGGRSTTLRRIDPRSNRVTDTTTLRHGYARLAATASGLWGTTCSPAVVSLACDRPARPALHRISLRDGRPTTVVPLPAGEITGLAAQGNGVWVAQSSERQTGGALRRLDATTGRLSTVLRLVGRPSNVGIGEGGVWIGDTFTRTLIRVPR